jgi:hypothetical protein
MLPANCAPQGPQHCPVLSQTFKPALSPNDSVLCCGTSRRIPHHQKHVIIPRVQTTRACPSKQQHQQHRHKQPDACTKQSGSMQKPMTYTKHAQNMYTIVYVHQLACQTHAQNKHEACTSQACTRPQAQNMHTALVPPSPRRRGWMGLLSEHDHATRQRAGTVSRLDVRGKHLLGAASKNGGDNMDEGMSRQRHGGTLAGEPPLTVNRLKCLGSCMKRRVFSGFTSVS